MRKLREPHPDSGYVVIRIDLTELRCPQETVRAVETRAVAAETRLTEVLSRGALSPVQELAGEAGLPPRTIEFPGRSAGEEPPFAECYCSLARALKDQRTIS